MSNKLIDTHCHFDFPPFFGDEKSALKLARGSGVNALIVPAVCAKRFDYLLALTKQYQQVYIALGLHPIYIQQHTEQSLEKLSNLLKKRDHKLVAVGEIGLDNFIDEPQLERQLALFEDQLALAKQHNLPVILHSRRTHDLMLKTLKQAKLASSGVIHGFSGSYEQACEFIKLGFYIGVGGTITYERAAKTRKAIAKLPLSSLLLETDAPDMPISGRQGQANRPEYLTAILTTLSEIRGEPEMLIAEQVYLNTQKLFSLNN